MHGEQMRQAIVVLLAIAGLTAPILAGNPSSIPWHEPRPIDDGPPGCLGDSLRVDGRIGVFHVEDERQITDRHDQVIHVYVARVLEPLHGLTRGERIVFTEHPDRTPDHRAYPKLMMGKEYLILPKRGVTDEVAIRSLGFSEPIACAGWSTICRTDVHNLHEVMPQLREYVKARFAPESKREAALRRWALANLDSKHAYLREVLHRELVSFPWYYRGATKEEVARLANYAEVSGGDDRLRILTHLAQQTDHPMEVWFLRALGRGDPKRFRPGTDASLELYSGILSEAAPRLSIEWFWPMIQTRTTTLNPWVRAFAQKADPRLLPFIVRHLEPAQLDASAADALVHYRGVPAAEEAVVRAATDASVRSDKRARAVARESLKRLGTPRALALADQLAVDDDEHSAPPGRDR